MEQELALLQNIINATSKFVMNYSFQLLGALIILIVGCVGSGRCHRIVFKLYEKAILDITISKFFANLVKIIVLDFVFVIAVGKFGTSVAPFIAASGAVAFGGTLTFLRTTI